MDKIIECVPNISEGRDIGKINQIVSVVEREGVKLLGVSSDPYHNRSVVTFAGEPQSVKDAAFDLIQKVSELIDMRQHAGEHPRMGAVDVCPFVPVSGVKMRDCVDLAKELGGRIDKELGLSGYFYEEAASVPERKNLTNVRKGQYEGLKAKLQQLEWKPDFGPAEFNSKFGAVVIGAREFLIAYNVNLKTTDMKLANDIARIIRYSGDKKITGVFKTVKALGIDTSKDGYVQVSMNLTNYKIDPVYVVFEAIKRMATLGGVKIHNSELVGLAPAEAFKNVEFEHLQLFGFDENKQIIEKALGL